MADYSHLRAQDVTDETTREYTFDMIVGEPSIILAPAHDSNRAFQNERLRLSIEESAAAQRAPRGKKPPPMTPESLARDLEADRETDRKLLSYTCARDWGTPPRDADGKTHPFTNDECYAFLSAMPDWMLDPFRAYAQNIYNFVERPRLEEGDGDELGNV